MQVLHSLHFSAPRDLAELRPGVPSEVVALIGRMLEKEPEKRPQTMAEVLSQELRRGAKLSMDGSRAWDKSWLSGDAASAPRRRRNKYLSAPIALLAVVAAGGFGLSRWIKRGSHPQAAQEILDVPANETAYGLYQRARQDLDNYGANGKVDHAIQLLERAIQKDPQSAASFSALAEAYYFKNRLQNPDPQWVKLTSEYAAKAVALDDDLGAAHIAQGLAGCRQATLLLPRRNSNAPLRMDPKAQPRIFGWLRSTARRERRWSPTRNSSAACNSIPMTHACICRQAGMLTRRKVQDAIAHWEEVRRLQPDNLLALQNLGAAYQAIGRDDDAAAALQQALTIKPTADTYNDLATLRFFQGHYQEAVPAFEKAVELGANHFDNWANLGDAYRWTPGSPDKAKRAYQEAIRLVKDEIGKHPEQIELKADLAMYLAKSGDKQGAWLRCSRWNKATPRITNVLVRGAGL